MRPLTAIYLSYGLPSLLCYALVVSVMARPRKTLATSFRIIFMVTAFFNIATYINTWLVMRLRFEPFFFFYYEWTNEVAWIRNMQQIGVGHLYLAQNLCVLLLTIDRFIAIFSLFADQKIKEIWARFFWIIVIVAHVLLVGLSLWTRLPMHTWYVLNVTGEYYITERDPSQNPIASFYRLYYLRNNNNTKSSPLKTLRHEYALFVLSLSVFLAQSLSFVFVMIMNFSNFYPDQIQINEMLMMFISDIFTLSPAFYTLFVRGPVRSQVALLFKKPAIITRLTSSVDLFAFIPHS